MWLCWLYYLIMICIFDWTLVVNKLTSYYTYYYYLYLPVCLMNGSQAVRVWRHNERDGVSNHQRAIVYSTVYSGADQRKHQSSASLAFVRGFHRWPVNSPHKGPVTRKMFPFDDVIMKQKKDLVRKIMYLMETIFISSRQFLCSQDGFFFQFRAREIKSRPVDITSHHVYSQVNATCHKWYEI